MTTTFTRVSTGIVMGLSALGAVPLRAQISGAGSAQTGPRRPLGSGLEGVLSHAYRMETGDTVEVTFRYTPEFNETAIIGPDGQVSLRSAGVIKAAGLTVAELTAHVAGASAAKLVNPDVVVTLKEYDRPHVFVAGEVNNPGRQDLRRPTTVLQAILMCGGPKDDAALGRVLLFRRLDADTAEVHVLQLAHYSRKARSENDMILQPDDLVLVRHDLPSRIERIVKTANIGLYLNPLQNVNVF